MAGSEDVWEIDWDAYSYEEEELVDPYEYVLGLDPGETTGVAMLRYTPESKPELIYLHQIEGGQAGFWEFFKGTMPSVNIHIASEKWVEFGIKGANHEPLKIEGMEYAIWEDDVTFQEPSQKQLIPDDYLKENNLWTPGKRHQMDALIHALIYLRNEEEHKPTLKSLSGDDEQPMAQPGQADAAQLDQPDEELSIEEQIEQAVEGLSKAEQAMKEMGEAAEAAAKALAEALEAAGEGEDGEGAEAAVNGSGELRDDLPEGTGPGNNDREGVWYDPNDEVPTDKRKRMEKNGVFMGYAPEESSDVKEIFVD